MTLVRWVIWEAVSFVSSYRVSFSSFDFRHFPASEVFKVTMTSILLIAACLQSAHPWIVAQNVRLHPLLVHEPCSSFVVRPKQWQDHPISQIWNHQTIIKPNSKTTTSLITINAQHVRFCTTCTHVLRALIHHIFVGNRPWHMMVVELVKEIESTSKWAFGLAKIVPKYKTTMY